MEQDENKFKVPNNEEEKGGMNPPPQEPGSYQQATPKVDNFSPPQGQTGDDSSGDSFKMPSENELNKPDNAPEPAATQTIKTSSEEEEPEDVFAKKEEAPSPPPEIKPKPQPQPEKPAPPPPAGQKLNIPEKKGSGCLWGIVVFLIVVILAEAIAINELGIFNLGLEKYYGAIHLEKLWGGLPKDAKSALANSASKMKGKNFNLDGSSQFSISIESQSTNSESPSSSTPTPSSNVQTDINSLFQEGLDYSSGFQIDAVYQSPDKLELNLTADTSNATGSLANILGTETIINLSLISDGSNIYVKNDALKKILGYDKDWLEIVVDQKLATGSSTEISNIITSGERTGSAKINGINCYIYEIKINGNELLNYISNKNPNFSWLVDGISIQSAKIYLGKRDHLMYKIEASFSNNSDTTSIKNKIVFDFYNVGKELTVDIPAPNAVAQKNWSDIENTFVSGATASPTPTTTSTPEERDKIRKSDMKKIQDALLAYKVQNGKYPSTLGAIEKTKDATSNLKTALVPKYLDPLPVDPENDKYYYGYKSDDGTKCEIWCILENKSDPDGENYNGFWIYKLRGN